MGSDAWLMVEALCGAPTERYLPAFAARAGCWRSRAGARGASGGIETWQRALAEAVTALLADERGYSPRRRRSWERWWRASS